MVDLTATTYALVGAAAGTSYVFFSNVGLTQVGTMALLNGRIADIKLSPADKVMAWSGYFFSTAVSTIHREKRRAEARVGAQEGRR
jgi:hypothetical protein